MIKTKKLVASILERTELLLHVTIATESRQQDTMAQSLTIMEPGELCFDLDWFNII